MKIIRRVIWEWLPRWLMRWDTTLVLIMIVHHAPVKVYSLRVESSADFSNEKCRLNYRLITVQKHYMGL